MVATVELERGRESHGRRAWADAYDALAAADRAEPLAADDLMRLAEAAYMTGRDDEYVLTLERAHHARLDAGDVPRAVRCGFWIGVSLTLRGDAGPASGWFGRARRLLEHAEGHPVERGYLLIPVLLGHVARGDAVAAQETAAEAAAIGMRLGDPDLVALALHEQGQALIRQGRVEEGLRLLDETMVAVTAGELSPIVTGLVYCNTIAFWRGAFELRRAREWTEALTQWCERQPEMVAHTGLCLVHRAEIMEQQGAWDDALQEARRARERCSARMAQQRAAGYALYREGEVHRLRGDLAAAEAAYREASRCGYEPQPGLALLRLAQGDVDAALASVRRVLAESAEPLARARLLPAQVEILLARGAVAEARAACDELAGVAARHTVDGLAALAAQARGAVALAEEDAAGALVELRRAWQLWQGLEAPYDAARVRAALALACRALGDEEAAMLELEAAREVFDQLGAAPDLARADALARPERGRGAHGLSPRELQVLRRLAAGARNREIAEELVLSERTVDRHVSNIFAKLGVSSRSAATAYAYEHELV